MSSHTPHGKFAIITLGGEEFGMPIARMVEILKRQTVVGLPDLSSSVLGVIHLRGQVIPVVDLRLRFRVRPAAKAKDRVVIVRQGRERLGIVVDDVVEIITFEANEITPPPGVIVSGIRSEYLLGIGRQDERMIVLLDLDRILAADDDVRIRKLRSDDAA